MSSKAEVNFNGTAPGFLLFLLFLGLKLTGYISWSWWWVTAPVWIPLGLAIVFFVLGFIAIWLSRR